MIQDYSEIMKHTHATTCTINTHIECRFIGGTTIEFVNEWECPPTTWRDKVMSQPFFGEITCKTTAK